MMSIDERRLRPIVYAAALLAVATVGGRTALADMVVVQQDNTPVASAPGVGGHIVTRADSGAILTVLGREGEWLQVTSPQLWSSGAFWVPAGRVGDIIAAPAETVPAAPAAVSTEMPQFRMTTGSTEAAVTTSLDANATIGSRSSAGVSAATARSTQANATPAGVTVGQSAGTATPSAGDPTPPVGNAVPAAGNGVTAVSGNPTPAQGNPTSAIGGNPTPAVGNPTPAVTGNPTPAVGNATPAMGNAVSGFGGVTVRVQ